MPLDDAPPTGDKLSFLGSLKLLRGIDAAVLRELEPLFQRVHLSSGETLMEQGTSGDCLYILASGRLRVLIKSPAGSEVVIGEIVRGEILGEMAILTDAPRSATMRAIRDSELLALPRGAFASLVERYPGAMVQISRQIVNRIQRRNLCENFNTMSTIAVAPAGRNPAVGEFSRRLAGSLDHIGRTFHVTSGLIDKQLGPGSAQAIQGAQNAKLLAWLTEQEMKYAFVVYECDPTYSPWTQRCLRQADRIIFAGLGSDEPTLGPIEDELQRADIQPLASTQLVLLHDSGTARPRHTAGWLSRRNVLEHHHLLMESQSDWDRFVRLLTGRGFGMVLGGGGARAMSHIGVLRAVQELGIPVDVIGGTSMGAGIAAMYASCGDYQTLRDQCAAFFSGGGSMLDYTLPFTALASGSKLTRCLRSCFGETHIEDLRLNYFCVSSNLTRADVMVHRRGPLWKWVRASSSLPGIFPPVFADGDLLVDGALMNNLPIDIMRSDYNVGTVMAVDVTPRIDFSQDVPFGEALSGWAALVRRLNPFSKAPAPPDILNIVMRATELASIRRQNYHCQQADLCLFPPVEGFGLLNFNSFEKAVEIGYRHARARLQEWLSLREQDQGLQQEGSLLER